MTITLFEQWFDQLFIPKCGSSSTKPVLLILDNASCHVTSPSLIQKAMANNIEILGLPSHTSHILQPQRKIQIDLPFNGYGKLL
jgi:hypothetical protein